MKHNKDGLPMKEGVNVPLVAGIDNADPAVTLHDKAIPEKLKTKSGKVFNLRESHDFHERVEYPLMQAGLSYDDAHRYATEAEHKRIRDLGFDPNEIELLAKPFINQALHRAKATSGYCAHATLDNQPYRDSDTDDTLNRGEEVDEREFYDKHGNEYEEPEQFWALGKVSFIIGCAEDGTYAAVEPSTATVWERGKTRAAAETAVDRKVRKHGLLHTREMIDAATPWSQQQLKAIFDSDD